MKSNPPWQSEPLAGHVVAEQQVQELEQIAGGTVHDPWFCCILADGASVMLSVHPQRAMKRTS
jgi:hypothetical protein